MILSLVDKMCDHLGPKRVICAENENGGHLAFTNMRNNNYVKNECSCHFKCGGKVWSWKH